ncbi:MAG: VWA domain-containing protein [Clostridiales bacterium]|nr:VWA domain-containing protein [Clostridiales bacterium]
MTNINLDNPYFLLIAIPLLALVLIPFFISFRKQNRDKHVIASLILHLLMVGCVVLAAAGLNVTRVVTELNVYVVADVSYSSNLNLDEVNQCILKVQSKLPENSRMGVVCFGRDAVLYTPLGANLTPVSSEVVDDSATDIFGAIDYTVGLFDESVIKRIVLITDGTQTGGADELRLRETVATLKQKDIYIDAIYLDATLPTEAVEIQFNGVDFVPSTYIGQGSEGVAYIQSNTTTTANVTLQKGDDVETQLVELRAGEEKEVHFTLDTTAAGSFDYTLTVENAQDGCLYNNTYSFTQEVADKQRILFLTSKSSDKRLAEELYKDENTELDTYVYSTKKIKPPTSIEQLCAYDEIILSNVNIPEQVENYTQFVDNLNVAVSMYGKTLLTYGNLHLQNKTDAVEDLENLENILPVQFGAREEDATLYGILIDVSRSMYENDKLRVVKDSALYIIDQLTPQDGLIIVSYSATGVTLMGMRYANETGKAMARDAINAITPIQGTSVASGLERMRLEMNAHTDFLNKQVLLLGDSMHATTSDAGAAVTEAMKMGGDEICVTTLDIDDDGDENFYKSIAEKTGGKSYKAYNRNGFSEEMLKEALEGDITEKLMGTVSKEASNVYMQLPMDPVLNGITSLNEIDEFICGKPKGDAVVVLTANYVKASGIISSVPLYSYRNCGKGKVATFTGYFSEKNAQFLDKDGAQAGKTFFRNVLRTNIPTENIDNPCLYTVTPGANTSIEVIPSNLRDTTSVEITLTTPSGKVETHALRFDVSRHVGTFETSEIGKYTLEIKYVDGDKEYPMTTTFMIPYLEEYNRFAGYSAGLLYDIVDERGIVSWDGNDISFRSNEDEIETYVYSLVIPLLIACVVLFVVDVFVRKIRWNDIKSLFVRTKKRSSNKGGKQ